MQEETLSHGDIVTLGDTTMLFSDEAAPQAAEPPSRDFETRSGATTVESRVKQFADPAEVVAAFRAAVSRK